MRGSENVFFLLVVIYFAYFLINWFVIFLVLLCVGEVVGLVVVLICEVFWLKTKGWKVCWFVKVWCWFVLVWLFWCCVLDCLLCFGKDQRLEVPNN